MSLTTFDAVPRAWRSTDATSGTGSLAWLAHLPVAAPELNDADWHLLMALPGYIADAERAARATPGAHHQLTLKKLLAQCGLAALDLPVALGGQGRPLVVQGLVQFLCGYHDLNLRDAATLGHAQLIAKYGNEAQRSRWLVPALAGQLIGIAATEPQGGSQLRAIRTELTSLGSGRWSITGQKRSVSRLTEASAFVVFCRDAAGYTAVVLDTNSPGLEVEPVEPAGLNGWSWGWLHLTDVRVGEEAILAPRGEGLEMFAQHFDRFRPLVAAAALGAAARVVDEVRHILRSRMLRHEIERPRDNALIALGRCQAQIQQAFLGALTALRLVENGHPAARTWAQASKAHGVDTAHAAVTELLPLAGAPAYQRGAVPTKTVIDLGGLRLADGVHDELFRSIGRRML